MELSFGSLGKGYALDRMAGHYAPAGRRRPRAALRGRQQRGRAGWGRGAVSTVDIRSRR